MKKNRLIALILCLSMLLCIGVAAAGGSEGESLVSLSFIRQFFEDHFFSKANQSGHTLKDNALVNVENSLMLYKHSAVSRMESVLADAVANRVIEKILQSPELIVETKTEVVSLYQGDRIAGRPGAGIILQSGTAKICGGPESEVLNVTTGSTREPGFEIRDGIYYMVLDNDQSGIIITSEDAVVMIKDGAYVVRGYQTKYVKYADILSDLGMFKGTDAGYELVRKPTRQEAIIMLIRMLGEEKEALAFDESNMPFTDVTGWVDGQKYIAYAAAMGYTNGKTATTFDQYGIADAHTFLTFVLRALGYRDSGEDPDFVWDTSSVDLAIDLGLLTEEQCADMLSSGLRRDHVVLICVNALFKQVNGTDYTLANKLINKAVVTQEQINSAIVKLLG